MVNFAAVGISERTGGQGEGGVSWARAGCLGLLLLTLSSDGPVHFLQQKSARKYKSYVLALKTVLRSNLQELPRS